MNEPRTPGEGRLVISDGTGTDLMEKLRATLEKANELLRVLEEGLQQIKQAQELVAAGKRTRELEERLAHTEADMAELAGELAVSERQTSRLMNLYVATYQLHSTLVPQEVQETIAEIAVNLLGTEKFVLLLRREEGDGYQVAFARGLAPEVDSLFAGDVYRGGDPAVDATLADGVVRLGEEAGPSSLAAVPLRVQGDVVGAIVILKLFDHKPSLRAEDRELLDLLSAHAASALFAAQVFATRDRKLRTLESLVRLARGE